MTSTVTASLDTDLLDAARTLTPEITARSLEIEAAGTLPIDLVEKLRARDLFRLAMPVSLGGAGVRPGTIIEIIEEVSAADGATGWTLLIGNIGNAFLAWLHPEVAADIVAGQPDVLIAGGQAPIGQGHLQQDGEAYLLTGRWPFGSGCLHANWYMGGFMVMVDGKPRFTQAGMPEMRVAYFPAAGAVIDRTWQVAGLAGTGSHDITVENLRVPAAHTSVPYVSRAHQPDPLYRLTAYNLLLTVMSGFPLGVGRRALDEAVAQLASKPHPAAGKPWLYDPEVQNALMHHRSTLESARRHLLGTLDEVLDVLADGEGDYALRARVAAACIHAYDVGRDAAVAAFRMAGASALHESNPLQRCLRDVVAGAQHVAFSADSRKRVANALLGLQTAPAFFGV